MLKYPIIWLWPWLALSLNTACGSGSLNGPAQLDASSLVGDAQVLANGDLAGGLSSSDAQVGSTDPCSPPRSPRPTVAAPTIPSNEYLVELSRWGIYSDNTHPTETTDGINKALIWASQNSYGRVKLPTGTYAIGKKSSNSYTEGIEMQNNTALVMDKDTTLKLIPTDTGAYCIVAVTGKKNVGIYGGTIRGDRDQHTFVTAGEEGHCICVQNKSELVAVEGVSLADPIGDGVLIVGQEGKGSYCQNITIANSIIANGRRQGISIVGGVNVLIENNEIHHVGGTAPQFGIDIEGMGNYLNKDILIRKNKFHHNLGGDFVNCDGKNIWFEENDCDQTGLEKAQTDGPVIHWQNTDQTIRANKFTLTVGSSNGRWGVLGYSSKNERTNPAANYFEDNTFINGGLHMMHNSLYYVTGNQVEKHMILGDDLTCLRLNNNAVNNPGGETYKFRNVRGKAQGNIKNGQPIDLAMTDDQPFTNSPPSMW